MRIDDDGFPVRHTVKDGARRLTPRQRSQLDGSVSKRQISPINSGATNPVIRYDPVRGVVDNPLQLDTIFIGFFADEYKITIRHVGQRAV